MNKIWQISHVFFCLFLRGGGVQPILTVPAPENASGRNSEDMKGEAEAAVLALVPYYCVRGPASHILCFFLRSFNLKRTKF